MKVKKLYREAFKWEIEKDKKAEKDFEVCCLQTRGTSEALNHFQRSIGWVDSITPPINTLCVLFVKITLIQDCKDPLELMEAELIEEELDVQDEV